jgi:hypothetical protein
LSTIDRLNRWASVLLVLPPVSVEEVRSRWDDFSNLLEPTAMAAHRVPADCPTRALVIAGTPESGWTAITADRRDEWTYTAALRAAIAVSSNPKDRREAAEQ